MVDAILSVLLSLSLRDSAQIESVLKEGTAILSLLLRHRNELAIGNETRIVAVCVAMVSHFGNALNRRPRRGMRHVRRPGPGTPPGSKSTLGFSQARQLTRLFTSFANTRSHGSKKNAEKRNAQSPILPDALAKHVPAIIIAYVRMVADPSSHVEPAAARELRSGLMTLCDLITAGGRSGDRGREGEVVGEPFGLGDGLMSDSERQIWANIWTSWAKSRYTGQG